MVIGAAPVDKKADYGSELQEGFNNLCITLESVRSTQKVIIFKTASCSQSGRPSGIT